mmetsp:Transcript_11752/g.21929  ORF Transcript_11752/g.21929 Transcript_11752/m.21929 type:complete len:84 (+) Transcript_11752:1644-1895(+)
MLFLQVVVSATHPCWFNLRGTVLAASHWALLCHQLQQEQHLERSRGQISRSHRADFSAAAGKQADAEKEIITKEVMCILVVIQ